MWKFLFIFLVSCYLCGLLFRYLIIAPISKVSTMTAQYPPIKTYSVLLYKPRHRRIDFEGQLVKSDKRTYGHV